MKLNKTTKKAQDFIKRYNESDMYQLFDLYKSYSRDKWRADYFIKENMKNLDAWGYKIIGGNCSTFTAGFMYKKDNKEILRIETVSNSYDIELN